MSRAARHPSARSARDAERGPAPSAAHRSAHRGRDAARTLQRQAGNRAVQQLVEGRALGALITPTGRGRVLAPSVRGTLESAFGRSLGHVRVHEGPAARATTALLGARAFAAGRDVWLSRGAAGDTALLGHEVAHVLQQASPTPVPRLAPPRGAAERAAQHAGAAVAARRAAGPVGTAPAGVQRADDPKKRPLDRVLEDPEAAKRLEEVVKQGGLVQGKIVEEIGNAELREALKTPEGRQKWLGEKQRDAKVEFYEAHRVRAISGEQLTDGIALTGSGDTRGAALIAEYKHHKEKQLAEHSDRRPSEANRAEAERHAAKTGAPVPTKEAGQFASVRERIRHDGAIEVLEQDGTWKRVTPRMTPDTVFVGGSPNRKALEDALTYYAEKPPDGPAAGNKAPGKRLPKYAGKGAYLGIRTAAQVIDATDEELADAERRLAAKAGVEPPSVTQSKALKAKLAEKKAAKQSLAAGQGAVGKTKVPGAAKVVGDVEGAQGPPKAPVEQEPPETYSEFPKQVVVKPDAGGAGKQGKAPKKKLPSAPVTPATEPMPMPKVEPPVHKPPDVAPPAVAKPSAPVKLPPAEKPPVVPAEPAPAAAAKVIEQPPEVKPSPQPPAQAARRRDTVTSAKQAAITAARQRQAAGGGAGGRTGARGSPPQADLGPRGGQRGFGSSRGARRGAAAEAVAETLQNILQRLNEVGIDKRIRDEVAARMPAIEKYQEEHIDDGVLLIARISEPDPNSPQSVNRPQLRAFVTVIESRGGRSQEEALAASESRASIEQGYQPGHRGSERRLIWIRPRRAVRPDDFIGGDWRSADAGHRVRIRFGPEGQLSLSAFDPGTSEELVVSDVRWHVETDTSASALMMGNSVLGVSVRATLTHPSSGSRFRSEFWVLDPNRLEEDFEGIDGPVAGLRRHHVWLRAPE